jgi:hypothetical protein
MVQAGDAALAVLAAAPGGAVRISRRGTQRGAANIRIRPMNRPTQHSAQAAHRATFIRQGRGKRRA